MAMSVGNGASQDPDQEEYRPISEINITPMVDVMLVLLIIFMITAPLLVAGVPVELPDTQAARISQPKKPMIVSLGGDGSLFIRDEEVSTEGLIPRLKALRSVEGDTVVYVRADKSRAYGEVMDLLGRVGQSGYGRVSLSKLPPSLIRSPLILNHSAEFRISDRPSVPMDFAFEQCIKRLLLLEQESASSSIMSSYSSSPARVGQLGAMGTNCKAHLQ